jgi:uncharacterized membrane protein
LQKKGNEMKNIVIGFLVLVLCFFSFFMGYGVGMSDPEPRETRELEKQIKTEELKKLRLNNEAMERALFGKEIK